MTSVGVEVVYGRLLILQISESCGTTFLGLPTSQGSCQFRDVLDMRSASQTICSCGCGQATTVDPRNRPRRFVHGHNRRGISSPEGWIEQGMRFVWADGKKRPLHRLIVEEKLGRPLRSDEIVRHRDGDLLNNDPTNLIVVSREDHFDLSMGAEAKEPWTEEEKDEAVRLYCEGLTIDQVANALSRSYSATRRILARWAVLRTPWATRALGALKESRG
jgi:HNH endonuclease